MALIIKLRPGMDLYMVWSTVADNLVDIGTSDELKSWHYLNDRPTDPICGRLDRADQYGTSAYPWKLTWRGPGAKPHREGGWRDNGFVVHNGPEGWLERRHFLPYAVAIRDGKMQKAKRLVSAFDDLLPEIRRRRRARVLYGRRHRR